jgi:hypothetical protein
MYDNDAQATLQWAGVYVAWAVKTKNKLSLMKALRCLGQNVVVDGDEDAAFSLFQITLEQFKAMDVHSWRADCMVRIAGILIDRGEPVHGEKSLRSARPLFDRCEQKDKVAAVDSKLTALNMAV